MVKKYTGHDSLNTWNKLNDSLRNANEEFCKKLLDVELSGRRRKKFILRIHSRLNRVRADREREELEGKI